MWLWTIWLWIKLILIGLGVLIILCLIVWGCCEIYFNTEDATLGRYLKMRSVGVIVAVLYTILSVIILKPHIVVPIIETTSELNCTVSEILEDDYVILTQENGTSWRFSIFYRDCDLLEEGENVVMTVRTTKRGKYEKTEYFLGDSSIRYDADVTDFTNYSYNYNDTILPKKGENV